RQCRAARADLALARGDAARALAIVDELLASAAAVVPGAVVPRLARLRGEALAALGRADEAEAALVGARGGALAQGARPLLWRVHAALGDLHHAAHRT